LNSKEGAFLVTDDIRNEQVRPKNEIWEWIKALLIAIALVALIRTFLFTPTVVSGDSMEPNFHDRQRLIVNILAYSIGEPDYGEVIVFHAPNEDEGKDFIKRVIALPGDEVKVEGDNVYINGKKIEEDYIKDAIQEQAELGLTYNNNRNFAERTVPEGKVFVLGDNRPISKDSRDIGFIEFDEIVGRADLVIWPLTDIDVISHD
jgi:signal peptidase I